MSLQVKLEAFEGPLDLLLHLIEKNKVNIFDIFGYVFFILVLYLFLVMLNIVPDAFGIKELINKIAY